MLTCGPSMAGADGRSWRASPCSGPLCPGLGGGGSSTPNPEELGALNCDGQSVGAPGVSQKQEEGKKKGLTLSHTLRSGRGGRGGKSRLPDADRTHLGRVNQSTGAHRQRHFLRPLMRAHTEELSPDLAGSLNVNGKTSWGED